MSIRGYTVVALFTMALTGLASSASAQSYRGKFTLPYETRWGGADLPAGDYSVAVEVIRGTPVLTVAGNGFSRSIFAGIFDLHTPVDGNGKLEVTDVNGMHVVTRLIAASAGKEYIFPIPKALRNGYGAVALKKAAVPVSSAQ